MSSLIETKLKKIVDEANALVDTIQSLDYEIENLEVQIEEYKDSRDYFEGENRSLTKRVDELEGFQDLYTEIRDSREVGAIFKFFEKHPQYVDNEISGAIYLLFGRNL